MYLADNKIIFIIYLIYVPPLRLCIALLFAIPMLSLPTSTVVPKNKEQSYLEKIVCINVNNLYYNF